MLLTKVENIIVEGYTFDFGIYAESPQSKHVNVRVIGANGKGLQSGRIVKCKSILSARLAINDFTLEQIVDAGAKLRQEPKKSKGRLRDKEFIMVKVQYYALYKYIGRWRKMQTSYLLNRLRDSIGLSDIPHKIEPTVTRTVKIRKHQYILAVKQGLMVADHEPAQVMKIKQGKCARLKKISNDFSVSHMTKFSTK